VCTNHVSACSASNFIEVAIAYDLDYQYTSPTSCGVYNPTYLASTGVGGDYMHGCYPTSLFFDITSIIQGALASGHQQITFKISAHNVAGTTQCDTYCDIAFNNDPAYLLFEYGTTASATIVPSPSTSLPPTIAPTTTATPASTTKLPPTKLTQHNPTTVSPSVQCTDSKCIQPVSTTSVPTQCNESTCIKSTAKPGQDQLDDNDAKAASNSSAIITVLQLL
jgi:hypothetical protein